jgi:hypothetical protein
MGIRLRVLFGLLVALMVSMVSSCKHELPVNPNPINNNPDTSICFERDILPVFISNCAKGGCHNAISAQDGYQFTDYTSIVAKNFKPGDPEGTKLYQVITETDVDKRMPQAPNPALSAMQIDLVRRWIEQGGQNTGNCVTPCDSNNFKYSTAIVPLVDKYCKGCHNGQSLQGGYNLDTYDAVKALALNGKLLGSLKHETGFSAMPKGGVKLSDCQITQVQKWIADGAMNN